MGQVVKLLRTTQAEANEWLTRQLGKRSRYDTAAVLSAVLRDLKPSHAVPHGFGGTS